jgi:hypothetical protein
MNDLDASSADLDQTAQRLAAQAERADVAVRNTARNVEPVAVAAARVDAAISAIRDQVRHGRHGRGQGSRSVSRHGGAVRDLAPAEGSGRSGDHAEVRSKSAAMAAQAEALGSAIEWFVATVRNDLLSRRTGQRSA